MKGIEPTIESLRDTFHMGYDLYEASRAEADEAWNLYHNRQWTADQEALLENRGQPKETFNVVKLFARTLVGYYSTVVNTAKALPRQQADITMATLGSDVINAVYEQNNFDIEGDKLKLSGMVSGIMVSEIYPEYTGERDKFNRPIYKLHVANVPDYEVVLDPMSYNEDYSDARFLHRFKWVTLETIHKLFGKDAHEKLESYDNHLDIDEAEFEYRFDRVFEGRYRVFDNYLLVHTTLTDKDDRRWSVYWCGEHILKKEEITYRDVKWPYRVVKTHTSDKAEYYGIFREVIETQKAINQALIKLQLMVNSQKVYVQKDSVDDLGEFTNAVNRVTGVVEVKALKGIKVENLAREALEQYQILDRAFDRVQKILGVNDSFLGNAFASDSGRKVKLQQNATTMALRYLTLRIEAMYKYLSQDILSLSNQYFYAEQTLRLTDELTGYRFLALNQPMMKFTGQFDEQGQPIMEPMFEQVMDPETNKPLQDDNGNLVFAPIPEEETEVNFDKLDITIEANSYNDEDEKAQLMIETVMSGQTGQMLSQINPAGFFQMSSLALRSMNTKYSPEIAKILEQTGQLLTGNAEAEREAQFTGASTESTQAGSRALKLPQNTNEVASDNRS